MVSRSQKTMPVVFISGRCCSGKTTRAINLLKEKEEIKEVVVFTPTPKFVEENYKALSVPVEFLDEASSLAEKNQTLDELLVQGSTTKALVVEEWFMNVKFFKNFPQFRKVLDRQANFETPTTVIIVTRQTEKEIMDDLKNLIFFLVGYKK